jgi:cob(I)alamin adenosyltransferase
LAGVLKDSHRIEAHGTLDELNAVVGVVRVMNAEVAGSHAQAEQLEEDLRWIQNKLYDLGGILATVPGQEFKDMPQVTGNDVTNLEKIIDRCQKDLTPLKEFILPGGESCRDFYVRRGRCAAERSGYACIFRGKSRSMRCISSL